jgi:hypothetical protein
MDEHLMYTINVQNFHHLSMDGTFLCSIMGENCVTWAPLGTHLK